jgi:hypothetical protein
VAINGNAAWKDQQIADDPRPEPKFVPLSKESQARIIRAAEEFRRAGRPMHPPPPTPVWPIK